MSDPNRIGPGVYVDPGTDLKKAIEWLQLKEKEGETITKMLRTFNAHPLDAALAFKKAFERQFSYVALDQTTRPTMVNVPTGVGTSEEVPWGRYLIPNTDAIPGSGGFFFFEPGTASGMITFDVKTTRTGLLQLEVMAKVKMKDQAKVTTLLDSVEVIIREESIFKGKAIKLKFFTDEEIANGMNPKDPTQNVPSFIDITGISEAELIFPPTIQALVETTVFTPLVHWELIQRRKTPLKRGVLLAGAPGTGKTLTMNVAARKGTENGWTVVYLDDVRNLARALDFLAPYGRGVVLAEDIDQVIGTNQFGGRSSNMSQILNVLDGVESKKREVMVILTTNFVAGLDPALLRPGRLDAVIPVTTPDAITAEKLIRLFAGNKLASTESTAGVGLLLQGHIPATIREVVERAKLNEVRRTNGKGTGQLTSDDLNASASGMVEHLKLLNPVAEVEEPSLFMKAIQANADAVGKLAKAVEGRLMAPVDAAALVVAPGQLYNGQLGHAVVIENDVPGGLDTQAVQLSGRKA